MKVPDLPPRHALATLLCLALCQCAVSPSIVEGSRIVIAYQGVDKPSLSVVNHSSLTDAEMAEANKDFSVKVVDDAGVALMIAALREHGFHELATDALASDATSWLVIQQNGVNRYASNVGNPPYASRAEGIEAAKRFRNCLMLFCSHRDRTPEYHEGSADTTDFEKARQEANRKSKKILRDKQGKRQK